MSINETSAKPGRKMDKTHLRILRAIKRGKKIKPAASEGMFFLSGDNRNMWATFLLDELQTAGYITAGREITPAGELWLIVNS